MTKDQKVIVDDLRNQGLGYKRIAAQTGLSENTVKSYLRRNPDSKPVAPIKQATHGFHSMSTKRQDIEKARQPCSVNETRISQRRLIRQRGILQRFRC